MDVSTPSFDQLAQFIDSLTDADKIEVQKAAAADIATAALRWIPNPGPQSEAYFSKADILLYGGQAGGGKSDLILGLAFNEHHNSLIMRRKGTELGSMIKRALEINGGRSGFNGSSPAKLVFQADRQIDFGSANVIGDEQSHQGRPHDLLCFDEGVYFAESQIRFLMTWLRTTIPGQRTRVVITSNPPIDNAGQWIVDFFAPWLDVHHPNPAKPGELRWFVTDEQDKDLEVGGPEPVLVGDRMVLPKSRTYIPASVNDNPYLSSKADYRASLDSLPEPYRSAFRDGNFMVARVDTEDQAIPTAWVRAAMDRWTANPDPIIPMCAIGVDIARGGKDNNVLAPRFDGWYAPMTIIPGIETPGGCDVAGRVITIRRNDAVVIVDLGGGWGAEAYGHLRENQIDSEGYLGVESTKERTNDGRMGFTNVRSKSYWQFREALDPSQPGGSPIMLPPDPLLLSDLITPKFKITAQGIALESKESVVARLQRSPDRGDAVIMAWTGGRKVSTEVGGWKETGLHRRARANVAYGKYGAPTTARGR